MFSQTVTRTVYTDLPRSWERFDIVDSKAKKVNRWLPSQACYLVRVIHERLDNIMLQYICAHVHVDAGRAINANFKLIRFRAYGSFKGTRSTAWFRFRSLKPFEMPAEKISNLTAVGRTKKGSRWFDDALACTLVSSRHDGRILRSLGRNLQTRLVSQSSNFTTRKLKFAKVPMLNDEIAFIVAARPTKTSNPSVDNSRRSTELSPDVTWDPAGRAHDLALKIPGVALEVARCISWGIRTPPSAELHAAPRKLRAVAAPLRSLPPPSSLVLLPRALNSKFKILKIIF